VRGLKRKNVAAELLEKLLKDERGKCRTTNSECRSGSTSAFALQHSHFASLADQLKRAGSA